MTEKEIAKIEEACFNFKKGNAFGIDQNIVVNGCGQLIAALRSERDALQESNIRCEFLKNQILDIQQYAKKLKKEKQAETEALERAVEFIYEQLPNDCPSNYGDPEICPSWCNQDECLQPSYLKVQQCYERHFRGVK